MAQLSKRALALILLLGFSSIALFAAPSISSLSVGSGPVGTSVTISGSNFGSPQGTSTVTFNGVASTPTSWGTGSIAVPVPTGASTGNIIVTVGGVPSNAMSFTVTPRISSLSPTAAGVGMPVTISGANFGPSQGTSTVTFSNGQSPATPTSWSDTSITTPVPFGAITDQINVQVGGFSSNSVNFTVLPTPTVTSMSPSSGPIGTWVTIAGSNFGTSQGTSTITFNGVTATTITTWTSTSIVVAVPAGTTTGNMVITVSGVPSAGTLFTEFVTPPIAQVVQVQPATAATGVPMNGRVVVRFAQPVPPVSVVNGILGLQQGSTKIAGTVAQSNDGLSLTFIPTQNLAASTSYTFSVQDIGAGQTTPQFQSTFTTGTTSDTTAPRIVQLSPPINATGIPINAPLVAQFTKPMDPSTLTPQAFSVTDAGVNITGTVQVDATGMTTSFVPSKFLGVGHYVSANLSVYSTMRDTSGNSLSGGGSFGFTTSFSAETQGPSLIGISPASGTAAVPLNAVVVLEFDRPLNVISVSKGFELLSGGNVVTGGIALSDSNKRITFTPSSALAATTAYTVVTTSQITDVGGLAMVNPGSSAFTTGSASDTTAITVTATSPASGAVGVPTNSVLQLLFSKPVNPITVTSNTVLLNPQASSSISLPGTITVSADAKTANFVPSSPLLAETGYSLRVTTGITDLEGHALSGGMTWSFTTGTSASTSSPTVMSISPENGVTGVSVNTKIDVVTSVPLSPAGVGPSSITISTGGTPVSGSVTLSSSRMTLTFTPAGLLASNTLYTVNVSGVTDQAGNALTPLTTTFTTGASSTADTTKPSVSSVSPTNGATGVSVNAPIVLTFNEGIDFSSVSNSSITLSSGSFSGVLAGVYSINSSGTVVTFTPVAPLPGSTIFTIHVGATTYPTDLAGNTANSFASTFTTAATADTTPPSVVSVTPSNGATNMGLNTNPVITFSESLNATTLTNSNFGLYANGARVSAGVSSSADNRVVTVSPSTLPPDSNVDVVVSSGVKDLSGNSVTYFVSQFTTADQFDFGSPSVSVQRPANGASNVPINTNVVVYINEPMVASSVQNALHVSQNGVLVSGTTQITDNGQVIQFAPSAPWQYNSQIQVFLDSTALDTDGTALNSYQGSFQTVADTSVSAPTVVSTNPSSATAPTNVVIEVGFSQSIDPTSVTGTSVVCFREFVGGWIQGYVGLLYGGQVLQFIPRYPLAPNTSYQCVISSNLRGANGVAFYGKNVIFTTGSGPDTTVPTLVSISPPNGSTNVGDNGLVRLVFSKSINPLTINSYTVQLSGGGTVAIPDSISFSNNNQSMLLTAHAPFPDNTQMTLAISGITDTAGNPVAPQTTSFTTGNGPDLVRPLAVSTNPVANAVSVPLNAVMVMQLNEPLDPGTVNTNNVTVSTNGQNISGTLSLSSDGETITFLPAAPLLANTIYSVHFLNGGITDLAGNFPTQNNTPGDFSFTTGNASSTTAPQVVGTSPANGATAIPTNAQVMIQFNEPVDAAKLNGVTLRSSGGLVNISQALSNGNQTLTLVPSAPLSPNTIYSVAIAGVQDLSGNTIASPVSMNFTTGTGANLASPSVASVSPTGGASGVSITSTVVRVTLAFPVNPLTVSGATFQVYPSTTHIPVPGTIFVSVDSLTLTFTPGQTLDPSTTYVISLTGGDLDLEGRGLSWSSQFTTASGSAGLSPVILSLNTTTAAPGTVVAVNGTYFGTSQGTSTITFNGTPPTIYSWSDSQIYAYVPTAATSGPLLVTVNGVASNSIVFNVQQTPTITSISPSTGAAGTVITINGTNFGNSYDSAPQVVGSPFTVSATTWNQTSLQAVIPLSAYPQVQSLTVKQNTRASSGVNFTVVGTPAISSLSPTSGVPGTPVAINGSNFGSTQGSGTVTFNGVPAASITSWGTGSITAVAPSNVITGPINVTVNSISSNPTQTFTVTTPAIGNLSPPAGAPGALVNINGSGFYSQGLTTQVFLNGVQIQIAFWGGNPTYPSMGTNQLTVRIPTGVTSGNITVVIGNVTSNSMPFTVEQPPTVTGVSPNSGQYGSWPITISGSGFGATQSSSTVTFYGGIPAQIVSWSDTAIQVVVPDGTSTGPFSLQVGGLSAPGPWFYINTVTQLTDSLGNQSSYASAILGGNWVVSNTQGPGCVTCSVRGNTQETVDAKGNLLTHTDDLNHTTTYTYDGNNNAASVSQQLNANTAVTTTYTYNSFGEVLTATDPLGNVTSNAYDAKANLTSVTSPAPDSHTPASVTQFAYNTLGELTQITDPLNDLTTLTYTAAGLIASITDAQNHVTTYQYDARGNRTAVIDPINGVSHPTTFAYDIMNRLTGITYPDGSSVSFGYDSRGRRTSVTDQNQKTTTYAYDDANRLTSLTDPASNVTTYNYDTEDNLVSITDTNNHATNFAYSARGWVTQTTFPSTLYETYAYDAGGNLSSKTDRKNQTIQYLYDALNRLTTKTYPDSTTANYVYDLAGKVMQVADPTGVYGFAYDNMGRLTGTTTQYAFLSNQTFTNAYTYDAASNRTSLTAPDGTVTTYGYDTLNRLNGLANAWAGSFGFGYDALNRRTSLTRPNGVNTSYGYDSLSRLLSVLHQTGGSTIDGASYMYDNAGNRTSKTNYLNGITENYAYDPLYELTQVTQGASTSESYSYDAVGNRLSSLGVPYYNYNSSNELTSNSAGSYTYDANGNTLSDSSGKQYTWDFENRLTQTIVPNVGTTTFRYDPFGRRIQKSGPLGTTNYVYDDDNLLEEVDSGGNVLSRYTQGPGIDRPLAELRSNSAAYYESDALGSVTSLTNSSATTVRTYAYDSFGNVSSSSGSLTNPFQFTGREYDSETGLYFYRARLFDSSIGRFISEDPMSFDGGNNFYAYVNNNPLTWVDPLGLVRCTYDVAAHHYHCTSDDGTQSFDTTRVRSGRGACMNNPDCSRIRNKGPIPPGRYLMGPMGGTPNPHRIPRVWLTPARGTVTFGRDSFEVHQGGDNSSAGCITLDPDEYGRFRRFYAIDNHGDVNVQ